MIDLNPYALKLYLHCKFNSVEDAKQYLIHHRIYNTEYIARCIKRILIATKYYEVFKQENKNYYKQVRHYFRKQNLSMLPNYDKRKFQSYHIHYIFPVRYGFKFDIPPKAIADTINIQIAPANISSKLTINSLNILHELINKYNLDYDLFTKVSNYIKHKNLIEGI